MSRGWRPGQEDRDGPGAPEAIPTALSRVVEAYPVELLDRIWIFPPRIRGRRESGLLALSLVAGTAPVESDESSPDVDDLAPNDGADDISPAERRRLVTLRYRAEVTGKGLQYEQESFEEGEAPSDRMPRVIDGVVRRTEEELGEPREVEIGGDRETLAALLEEFDVELPTPDLPEGPETPHPETAEREADGALGEDQGLPQDEEEEVVS